LQRYVELTIGAGDSTADTAAPGSPWLAETWRDRFEQMLQRAEARLPPQDHGPIETLYDDAALLENPEAAIDLLLDRYPTPKPCSCIPRRAVLHHAVQDAGQAGQLRAGHRQGCPALVAQRLTLAGARRPLRRRPGVHHPGTAAVAGITRLDEPVGALLDRFEQAAVEQALAAGPNQRP